MAEVYKIMAEISLAGNILPGLEAISAKLLGISTKVKEVEGGLARWRLAIAGAGALFGAEKLVEGMAKVVEHGAKFEHFVAIAKSQGLSMKEVGDATAAAWANVGANINASATESLKNILELKSATGSLDEAVHMLPGFTKASNALDSIKDEGLHNRMTAAGQSFALAKSLDMLGVATQPDKLDSYIQGLTKSFIALNGVFDSQKLFIGVQNAGGSRYGWSEAFVEKYLGPLLMESPRNGFGLYQMQRSLGQGVMTEMMAGGLEKYGFFTKEDEVRVKGKYKGMKVGSVAGYDELLSNPYLWGKDVALPLLKSHGVDIDNTAAMIKAINEISRGNKNLNMLLDAILLPANRRMLDKDAANISKVPDNAADVLQANDPKLAMNAFKTAWDNLLTSLGAPGVMGAVNVLQSMAGAMDKLAVSFAAHPDGVRYGLEATAGLAAALGVFGTGAIVAAAVALAPGGAVVAGIAGLATGIGLIAAMNWQSVSEGFASGWKDISSQVSRAVDAFKGSFSGAPAAIQAEFNKVASAISDAIASIPGKVMGAIGTMASSIAGAIGNAIKSITPGGGHYGADGPVFVPNSYHGGGVGSHAQSASLVPPSSNRAVHLTGNLYADGRQLGRVAARGIVMDNRAVSSAAGHDGRDSWAPPDVSFA